MTVRLDFPFTRNDSPELRARIHRDLAHAWRVVQEADPRAVALVLTGGFSRGEGSAIGARPLNDYDFVVVRDRPWPLPGALYGELTARLERDLALHIDLMPIWRARLRVVQPKAFWFDLKHGGRVIAGDASVMDDLPALPAESVRKSEAPRLLANRTVGLLEALPGPDGEMDALRARVQSAKAVLAVVEAALVLEGRYSPSVAERMERFRVTGKRLADGVDYVAAAEWATAFKLDPEGPAADVPPDEAWTRARRVLLAFARHCLPRAGWGAFDAYPEGAPFEPVEWAYATVRERALASPKPSHDVRAQGFRLLERCAWPGPPEWPAPLDALTEARGRTLH